MNISELSEIELKAYLYECVLEKERIEHNMEMLRKELVEKGKAEVSPPEKGKEGEG
jgi:hypothetical protein